MVDDADSQDGGPETSSAGVDPAAVALALNGASREKADAYLDEQRSLIAVQKHHLREQLKRLKMGVISDRLSVALKVLTGFVGLAVAAGFALMIWYAAHANGLIIESFSVPPDMASRGFTGQVLATEMLDKLIAMQNATGSSRPAQSYANNWGNDLKVEIPNTGISIGEAYSVLRGWLGHETHITGEVYRTATGIAVTARSGTDVGATYAGPETDLDALVQKAAEHVYGITQPYRYANYLFRGAGRIDESRAVFTRLTSDPDPLERAWAWFGLGVLAESYEGNQRAAALDRRKAIELNPEIPVATYTFTANESVLGHFETALASARALDRLLTSNSPPFVDARYINPYRLQGRSVTASLLGDYTEAVSVDQSGIEIRNDLGNVTPELFRPLLVMSLAWQHNGIGALAYFSEMPPPPSEIDIGPRAIARFQIDAALENWQAVTTSEASVEKTFAAFDPGSDFNVVIGTRVRPILALAKAELGDTAGAEAVIATTAPDCYDCIRMRGDIAAIEGNWGRAGYWFARTVRDAPSIPFAYADWGRALLDRGDPDGAIAKFTLANQKGPKFADPLEMWGEALMKKNRADLALAKFTEAEKYAPNWGRLHLKWGEALGYAGNREAAQKQYALAAGLDLSVADKAELGSQMRNKV